MMKQKGWIFLVIFIFTLTGCGTKPVKTSFPGLAGYVKTIQRYEPANPEKMKRVKNTLVAKMERRLDRYRGWSEEKFIEKFGETRYKRNWGSGVTDWYWLLDIQRFGIEEKSGAFTKTENVTTWILAFRARDGFMQHYTIMEEGGVPVKSDTPIKTILVKVMPMGIALVP